MADIYIINSETPKDIVLELQKANTRNTYTVLKSKTAKAILSEIEELKKKEIQILNKDNITDIYIINSETPKDIALELQQLNPNNKYITLKAKAPKAMLVEIETLKYGNDISIEQRKKIFREVCGFVKRAEKEETLQQERTEQIGKNVEIE